MLFVGEPGRKCGYVHTDVVWLNVYNTDEREIGKLEEMFLDKSPAFLNHEISKLNRVGDAADYFKLLAELGLTEEQVRVQVERDDVVPFPDGTYSIGVYDSPIEGKGVFATSDIKLGDYIAPAFWQGGRTPLGRYTNHSRNPNTKVVYIGEDVYFVASRDIKGMRGGRIGEEITVDYRKVLGDKSKCQQ